MSQNNTFVFVPLNANELVFPAPFQKRAELQELKLWQYWSLQINIPLLVQACYLYRKHTRFKSMSSDCTVHNKCLYELHRRGAQHDKINDIAGLM